MPNDYPPDWPDIAKRVKDAAGWKCERCGAVHETACPYCKGAGTVYLRQGAWVDHTCRECRGRGTRGRILTVHHLDGDKANCADWNLAALCQRCHLSIQARVDFYQGYLFEHSPWLARPLEAYGKALGREKR